MEIPPMQSASKITLQCKQGLNKDSKRDARTTPTKEKCKESMDNSTNRGMYNTRTYNIRLFACLVILLNFTAASACPQNCACSVESTAFCNNKHLISTPTDFTPVVERLYLFNNNISTISPRSLQPLKNLKLLDLSGNRISNYALWKGIFTQLKLLENLMLQENQIARITKDMFSGLTNLARIYLQDNQIVFIEDGSFDNLPNLVELKLRHNRLTSFPRIRDTPNLLLLDLGFNRLRTIRDLALSTVNLEYLKLQSNQLTQLRTSIFDETSRLTQLDISDNKLTAVPLVIKSLTSLRGLNMSLNNVSSIPADTFTKMEGLKALYLRDMGLKSLPFGIIPPNVILNVLDISDNDWDCKCPMHWLPQYISLFEESFVHPEEIKCSISSTLGDRTIKDLKDDDFGCTEEEIARTLHPTTKSTTAKLRTPPSATRKPWSADPCEVYPCFNEGSCYISNNLPKCICARNWFGQQCRKSRFPPTTTTTKVASSTSTTTKRARPSQKPQLLINEESITKDSVEIILPQTETELVISVSEIGQNTEPTQLTIKPLAHPFTVKGLESGKSYNICVHLPLIDRKDRRPPYLATTDTLCGSVKTDGIKVVNTPVATTRITVVPSPDDTNKEEAPGDQGGKDVHNGQSNVPGHGDKHQGSANNPNTSPTESTEFKIIYPAVGAGIGALIIIGVVVMFFVCYRRRRMKKFKNQGSAHYIPGSPIDGTQSVDIDTATVVHHHHHNHYNASGMEHKNPSNSKKQTTSNKKQKKQQSNFTNNNSATKPATPNKTSSLGRSSNSSNSSNGTVQSRYVDSPSHYPSQQYVTTGVPNHHPYEGLPPQRNARGGEYIYRNHQNNSNSAMQIPGGLYMPMGRPYDPEVMDDMQPLMGVGNQHPFRPGDGLMYQDAYSISPRGEYIPPGGAISYPQTSSRSAFQPIQGPRKNTVGTPTSESGPITTHVNTAHVLPTSTCLNRNLMSDNMARYPEGVPVV